MAASTSLCQCLMPVLWLAGALVFMGFDWVYVVYSIVKVSVIIGAHRPPI